MLLSIAQESYMRAATRTLKLRKRHVPDASSAEGVHGPMCLTTSSARQSDVVGFFHTNVPENAGANYTPTQEGIHMISASETVIRDINDFVVI
jgi:hypothetical protein